MNRDGRDRDGRENNNRRNDRRDSRPSSVDTMDLGLARKPVRDVKSKEKDKEKEREREEKKIKKRRKEKTWKNEKNLDHHYLISNLSPSSSI